MKKKEYIIPVLKVRRLHTTWLLAGSGPTNDDQDDPEWLEEDSEMDNLVDKKRNIWD